ncbi:RAB GTPase-activating protein, putative, partial [Ixodes scapularis]
AGRELTEAELLERAAEERAAIVARYDRGRENVAEIDPWEDPKFELYHVTDKYGFIHNSRLPDKYTGHEAKVRDQENVRLNKWRKMLEAWDKYYLNDKVGLAFGPDRLCRLELNFLFSRQQALFHVLAAYSVYNTVSLLLPRKERRLLASSNRTRSTNRGGRAVLECARCGKCQVGDSTVGTRTAGLAACEATLLGRRVSGRRLSAQDAFWAISVLMTDERHAMHGFFIQGFPKLRRFQEHHDRVLGRLLPKLKRHLDRYEMHTSLYTLKWFFQCFLDRVPFTLTLRLWDAYVLDGEPVLTAMSYTLLRLHRKTLLRQGMEEMIEFLQARLEQDFGFHDDAAMEALQGAMEELRRQGLQVPPGRPPPDELPQRPFG